MNSYKKLSTQYYDITKPEAMPIELQLYINYLGNMRHPILEAMCGAGRLLIPLLRKGYCIEGVDNSLDMLARCKERTKQEGLDLILYQQSIETLFLDKQYGALIIGAGSFQLLDKQYALAILQRLRKHLLPHGILVMDLFIPFDQSNDTQARKDGIVCSDGSLLQLTGTCTMNYEQQYYVVHTTYEKISEGKVLETEDEELIICWYLYDEMKYLLEQAGYTHISMEEATFDNGQIGYIYKAYNQ